MKRTREQFRKILRYIISLILVFSHTAIFSYTWINNYNDYIVLPFVQKGNLLMYAIYSIVFILFLAAFDGFKFGTFRPGNLIAGQFVSIAGTLFVVYMQIVLLSAKFVSPVPLFYTFVWDAIVSTVITYVANVLYLKIFPPKRVLLLYDTYSPETFLLKLKQREDIFNVTKIMNVSEGIEKIEEYIENVDSVILYDVHTENRNKILKICFENNIRTYATSKISDILIRGAERLHIFDTPLLLYRNLGLTFMQHFFKRLFDIVFSLIMLIITSPILLICAIAIKVYDRGPVFFRQARGTINGKIFYIHKFRSMIVDAEKDGAPKPCEDFDPRITPVGKVLRATRLDELPQLIDVLFGNMSIVGPRPERIEHIKQYTEEIPEFQYRQKVRGGITGLAQLYGKYNTSPYDKLQLDLMYIQNYSFLLDIRLILMTIKIMFMKESTEGFTKEKSELINEKSHLEDDKNE